MNKKLLVTAAIIGVLGIVLGAFAAHGLENAISKTSIETFETGVRYQMYHALLMLFLANTTNLNDKTKRHIWTLIVLGLIFFSGSIYGLATNDLTNFDFKKIALLTPVGGLLLIVSWLIMLIQFIRIKTD